MQAPLQARNDFVAIQTRPATTATQQQSFVDNRPVAVAQRKLAEMINNSARVSQQRALSDSIDPKSNNTGLPDQLKSGIESLSGMSMDHVKVHYNSEKPAQLQAHAYAQGSEIYVVPGQERHLPHEAWHVVQQAQGRVKPTLQMKGGVSINDDTGLEKEADLMGDQALKTQLKSSIPSRSATASSQIAQLTVWEWSGSAWTHVRSEGQQTQPPTDNGTYHSQRVSTGQETDLYADTNPVVQPPSGYTLVADSMGTQAYLADPRGHNPTGVALDHIVDVARGNAGRVHRSKNMSGHSQPTYVHPSDHELYTFSTQAAHTDGLPRITIHEVGKVRAGVHKFE